MAIYINKVSSSFSFMALKSYYVKFHKGQRKIILFYQFHNCIFRAVYKCNYDQKKFNASDCSELFNVGQEIHEDAEPMGLAVDTSDHVWLLIGNNEDKGALIELDPETGSIVSNIGIVYILYSSTS